MNLDASTITKQNLDHNNTTQFVSIAIIHCVLFKLVEKTIDSVALIQQKYINDRKIVNIW